MAKVWLDVKCPSCGESVQNEGVMIAAVRVTTRDTYGSGRPESLRHNVAGRVNFKARDPRRVWHVDCFPHDVVA